MRTLEASGFIPIIAPVGVGESGETYNINADWVASKVAVALNAMRLILLTDVEGVMDKNKSLISSVKAGDVQKMLDEDAISGGMIPKTQACLDALEKGCQTCHIIDGRVPHSALLEIFSVEGIGTLIRGRK